MQSEFQEGKMIKMTNMVYVGKLSLNFSEKAMRHGAAKAVGEWAAQ
jgi:hypothetical protein